MQQSGGLLRVGVSAEATCIFCRRQKMQTNPVARTNKLLRKGAYALRIGILTYHRSINYGAVTQCYTLANRLQRDFPNAQVEVIDYAPQWRIDSYKPTLKNFIFKGVSRGNGRKLNAKIVLSKLAELIAHPGHYCQIKARYAAFQRSLAQLPLSKEAYRQSDTASFRAAVRGKYDLIVVGSDCVWNWTTVPLPSPYYLSGDFGAVKASFAASVGTDDYAKLSERERQELREAIDDFRYVGVRDSSSEYVVQGVCPGKPFFHNCDPTTLLDPAELEPYRRRAREKLIRHKIDPDKPIVCVMGNEKLGKLARAIFCGRAQLVGVYVPNRYCDVFLPDLEALEWAALFGLCRLTLTTFFHGTMLSLVNRMPVLSFDYLPETERQHTKLHELYDRLGLQKMYYRGQRDYAGDDLKAIEAAALDLFEHPPTAEIAAALEKEAESYDSLKAFIRSLE